MDREGQTPAFLSKTKSRLIFLFTPNIYCAQNLRTDAGPLSARPLQAVAESGAAERRAQQQHLLPVCVDSICRRGKVRDDKGHLSALP